MTNVRLRLACGPGATFLAFLVLLTAAVGTAAGESPTRLRIVSIPGDVTSIAADGSRVAAAVRAGTGCDRAVVWVPALVTTQTFVSKFACSGAAFHEMPEVALAGNRVEWVAVTGGNLQDMALETAVLGKPKISVAAFAENKAGAEGGVDGDWIGDLFGDGSLLVFDTWHECAVERPEGSPPCPAGAIVRDVVVSQTKLWRLGSQKSLVRANTNAYEVVGLDTGRIAVRDPAGGSVAIVSAAGAVTKTIAVPAGDVSGVAFQGRQLVVLENGLLDVYDVAGGDKPVKSIPVPAGKLKPVLRDVQSGLAVYVRGTSIHVVRLADGKNVRIVPSVSGHVDAQLEPGGLFYSYTLPRTPALSRIAFLPRDELLKKFH